MTRLFIALLSVSLFACNTQSEISDSRKLLLTARVWGFLKYYHPEVNKGQLNWDDQLGKVIQKLPEVRNGRELSTLYLDWIESLGNMAPATPADSARREGYFDRNFDLSWLRNTHFTQELTDRLIYLEKNRAQKLHYVARAPVGQIEITNEPIYTASQWKDQAVRLTMLFRYWNVIEYFYPYKYKMDKPWDEILETFIPRFIGVQTESEYHLLLHELCVTLGDSHAFFVTDSVRAFAGTRYVPARFTLLNDKAVFYDFYDDSLARLDDLRLGDAVTHVNNIPVATVYQQNEKYITGSNTAVKQLGYAHRWIFNGNTDTVNLTYERSGTVANKRVRRYPYSTFKPREAQAVKWKKIGKDVGYANMEEVLEEDLPRMMKELKDTKAILFDLRNYPEFIIDEVMAYLNPEPRGFAKFIEPDLTYPGRFVWTPVVLCGKQNPDTYKGRVIILANEDTQSRAEYFVMALQTVEGAITIGRQTSGADGDVLDFTFFDDRTSWITGRGVFYPDGRETHRIGIALDIKVPITVEDIAAGRDAILEEAIEVGRKVP